MRLSTGDMTASLTMIPMTSLLTHTCVATTLGLDNYLDLKSYYQTTTENFGLLDEFLHEVLHYRLVSMNHILNQSWRIRDVVLRLRTIRLKKLGAEYLALTDTLIQNVSCTIHPTLVWKLYRLAVQVFTILAPGEVRALEVLNKNGYWISAPPKKGCFVVNVGDQLQTCKFIQLSNKCLDSWLLRDERIICFNEASCLELLRAREILCSILLQCQLWDRHQGKSASWGGNHLITIR